MHLSIILNLKISKGKYSFKVFSAYTMNTISCKEHNSKKSYFVKCWKEQLKFYSFCIC